MTLCFYPTKVFGELGKLRQLPDKARGLLVVGAERKDSLVGGVGGGTGIAGQRGVMGGEGLGLDGEAGCEFIIQHPTGRLREDVCESLFLLLFTSS